MRHLILVFAFAFAAPVQARAGLIPDQWIFGSSGIFRGPLPGADYHRQLLLTSDSGTTTVDFYRSGFRDNQGYRESDILDHNGIAVGLCSSCFNTNREMRDWIAFQIPNGGPYTAASFRLAEFSVVTWPGETETLGLYDVSTPFSDLFPFTPQPALFDDLGTGVLYGTYEFHANTIGPTDFSSPIVTIPLDDAAVAAINAARGDNFVLGGRLLTIDTPAPEPRFGGLLCGLSLAGLLMWRSAVRRG